MLAITDYIKEIFEDVHILYTMSGKSPNLNFKLREVNRDYYNARISTAIPDSKISSEVNRDYYNVRGFIFDCGRINIYKNDVMIKFKFPFNIEKKLGFDYKNPCFSAYEDYKSSRGEPIYEFYLKYTENDYSEVLQFIRQILNYYLQ